MRVRWAAFWIRLAVMCAQTRALKAQRLARSYPAPALKSHGSMYRKML